MISNLRSSDAFLRAPSAPSVPAVVNLSPYIQLNSRRARLYRGNKAHVIVKGARMGASGRMTGWAAGRVNLDAGASVSAAKS